MPSTSSCSSNLDESTKPSFEEACRYLAKYKEVTVSAQVLEKVSNVSSPPRVTDYLFYSKIGDGSYARVYCMQHKTGGPKLAMKVMSKKFLARMELCETSMTTMVLGELRLLRLANSHFTLNLKASFHDFKNFYVVTELCKTSLWDLWHSSKGNISLDTIKFYTAELTCGISDLHGKGIVHRDIKLENILLSDSGHIVIADFGMAYQFDAECDSSSKEQPTISGQCGSLGYSAYEVMTGGSYSYPIDWFSLGVIAHTLYIDDLPWLAETFDELLAEMTEKPFEVLPSVGEDLAFQTLIAGLLDYDQNTRFGARDIITHEVFDGWNWTWVKKQLRGAPLLDEDCAVVEEGEPEEATEFFKIGTPYTLDHDPFPECTWVAPSGSANEVSRPSSVVLLYPEDEGGRDDNIADVKSHSKVLEDRDDLDDTSVRDLEDSAVVTVSLDVSNPTDTLIVSLDNSSTPAIALPTTEALPIESRSMDRPSTPADHAVPFTSSLISTAVHKVVVPMHLPPDPVDALLSANGCSRDSELLVITPRDTLTDLSSRSATSARPSISPTSSFLTASSTFIETTELEFEPAVVAWAKLSLLKKVIGLWKSKVLRKRLILQSAVASHDIVLSYRVFRPLHGYPAMMVLQLSFALGLSMLAVRYFAPSVDHHPIWHGLRGYPV